MGNTNNNPSIILVIGNGFDLDLGLNTSYKTFIDKMYIKTQHPESTNTLIDAMIKNYKEANWIDIELFLKDYAKKYKGDVCEKRNIGDEYRKLKKDLCTYMLLEKYPDSYNTESFAYKILHKISSLANYHIYTFNYTDLPELSFVLNLNTVDSRCVTYIHGNCKNNNIILGFDECDTIHPDCQIMIKSRDINVNPSIINGIESAKNIIFFGLNICNMDYVYFEKLFNEIQESFTDKTLLFINQCREDIEALNNALADKLKGRGRGILDFRRHAKILMAQTNVPKQDSGILQHWELNDFINKLV